MENPNQYLTIRRLGPGDESVLAYLALNDASFDIPGRSEPLEQLSSDAAQAYLSNPSVLHWVAFQNSNPVGFLYCVILPMRAGKVRELLLYEIGVQQMHRRQGIGRLLMTQMEIWMVEHGLSEVWVLADNPAAEEFYRSCGFLAEHEQPAYMTRLLTALDTV